MQLVRFVGGVRSLALAAAGLYSGGSLLAEEAAIETKPVNLIVKLPADATLELAGQKVESTGDDRRFVIPPLAVGPKVEYAVKGTWTVDGRPESKMMTINITGGQTHEVTLGSAPSPQPDNVGDGQRHTVNYPSASAAIGSSSEQEVLRLCNAERARYGLSPLTLNPSLNQAAGGHSANMSRQGVLSHDLNGSFVGRVQAQSYSGMPSGENIAHGATSPADVVRMWMNSPGHRANILNPNVNELGVGQASGGYWTQVFGRR